jgi:toxin YoeB
MPCTIELLPPARKDYLYWEKHDRKRLAKIDELLDAIKLDPFKGIGHPELPKHDLRGAWSRQISERHRLVYTVEGDLVLVYRCYGHYE